MPDFKPDVSQFSTAIRHQHRITTDVNGAVKASYVDADPAVYLCEYKPFYGSEAVRSGTVGIIDGGTITMWYAPGFKRTDRVLLNDDASLPYEIEGIENVGNRNRFLIMKVKRVVSA